MFAICHFYYLFAVVFTVSFVWLSLTIFLPFPRCFGSSCTMDGIHGDDSRIHISDGQHPIHVPYVQEHEHHGLHHMSNGNGIDEDQNDGGDTNCGGSESVEGDIPSSHGNLPDNHAVIMDQGGDAGDQLTLSFQGQVYVFDSVSPEKVHQLMLFSTFALT